MTKLPICKRFGNVPQFPIGVDVAVAEVGTTNRLGFQLLMYQTYVSLSIVIMAKKMTPNPEVEEQQCDDVLLLIGDPIVDPMKHPNEEPDDIHIEDVAVEDVVPEGIVVEKDLVEDPNKAEEMIAEELITMVRETTRGWIGRSLPEKELNIRQRRRLELIKNYEWEILYHSRKANVVADTLSKKERLKMIMSLGEFIRDFEKMEIEVKENWMKEVTFKNVKCKTGGLIPRKGDAREYRRNNSRITLEVLQGESEEVSTDIEDLQRIRNKASTDVSNASTDNIHQQISDSTDKASTARASTDKAING
ncbi:hypothetical protein AgCh_026445 [Apium graveolens]